MSDTIAATLALHPGTGFQNVDEAQWAHLEVLLTDSAPDDLAAALRTFVPAGSSAVIGVFDDSTLWASLVVSLDQSGAPVSLTTIEGSLAEAAGGMAMAAAKAVKWVEAHYGPCSLGLFVEKVHAEAFVKASDKATAVRTAAAAGGLVLSPIPPALAIALA